MTDVPAPAHAAEPDAKPRFRVPAATYTADAAPTFDSFQNFAAGLGQGTDNLISSGGYGYNPITRNRMQLEWAYRSSWLVAQAVDIPAEDMTRAGIEIVSSGEPKDDDALHAAIRDLQVWQSLASGLRWGGLYGGALAVMLINGQDPSQPLNVNNIPKDSFRGLLVMDRWQVVPSVTDLVTDLGPDMGKPRFYDVYPTMGGPVPASAPGQRATRIHYSRVLRFEGIPLPFWQRWTEQLWGESKIERLWDRLMAYDSTSAGVAQLVFKAQLRTLKVRGLRNIIAAGGKAQDGLIQQLIMMRRMQTNEGMTMLDGGDLEGKGADEFEAHQFTFAGLADVLGAMGEQLAGAMEVPLVRLFGQSPSGFSSGDADLQMHYDTVGKRQERDLRRPLTVLLDVAHRSVLGKPPPDGFSFKFTPLWQMKEVDKAEVVSKKTAAIMSASSVLSEKTTLLELREMAATTGTFGNISEEDIKNADDTPPSAMMGEGEIGEGSEGVQVGQTKKLPSPEAK